MTTTERLAAHILLVIALVVILYALLRKRRAPQQDDPDETRYLHTGMRRGEYRDHGTKHGTHLPAPPER